MKHQETLNFGAPTFQTFQMSSNRQLAGWECHMFFSVFPVDTSVWEHLRGNKFMRDAEKNNQPPPLTKVRNESSPPYWISFIFWSGGGFFAPLVQAGWIFFNPSSGGSNFLPLGGLLVF